MNPFVAAAADYLSRGLPVIALTGKTPNVRVHKHGLHEPLVGAPQDEGDWDLLRYVFEHGDTTGIGIVVPFPYVVVDIDGEQGAVEWADLILPDGIPYDDVMSLFGGARWVAKTGRGMHLWFACSIPTGTIKLGSKLDLKAQGGYVVAPPSLHPDGGHYLWLRAPGEDAPSEVPEPLREVIEDHVYDRAAAREAKEIRRNVWGPKYQEGDKVFYAQASHEALIEGMSKAAEGNRNNYLHWAAATLNEEGGSDEEFEQLAEAALAVGLEPIEVKRTVRSARRA